jgi:hypothetical protein
MGSKLGARTITDVYRQMEGIIDWIATEAVAIIGILFVIYIIWRVGAFWLKERGRGEFIDVIADVCLRAGLLALFLMPNSITMIAGKNAPAVMWLPYEVAHSGWLTADIAASMAFSGKGVSELIEIPNAFAKDAQKAVDHLNESAQKAYNDLGAENAKRLEEASRGTWYERFGSWVSGIMGAVAGGLGGAGAGAALGSIIPGLGTIAGAILGGLIGGGAGTTLGAVRDTIIEAFFIFGVWLAFYACILGFIIRSMLFCFTFIPSIVLIAIAPSRGIQMAGQAVTKAFSLALYPLALVFMMKLIDIIYTVILKGFLIAYVSDAIGKGFGGGPLGWIIWLVTLFAVPIALILPLGKWMSAIPNMLLDALGVGMGYEGHGGVEEARSRGMQSLKHVPGL